MKFSHKFKNIFPIFLVIIVFAFLIFLNIQKIQCFDIWGHLAFGRYIVNNLSLPTQEVFSYTAQGRTFLDFYWFYQVLFYLLYLLGSIPALIIGKTIIVFFTFLLLFLVGYRKIPIYIWLLAFTTAILTAEKRFFVRPQIFSFFFLSFYLFALTKYSEEDKKWIYFLPVIQIFWANIHTISYLGPVILLVYIIGNILNKKVSLPFEWNKGKIFSNEKTKIIFFLFLICLTFSFLNPYGYKVFTYHFDLYQTLQLHSEILPGGIRELAPISFSTNDLFSGKWLYFKILILLSFISILINIKRQNISTLIIFLAFLYFAKRMNRGVGVFSIFACFTFYQNTKMIIAQYKNKFQKMVKTGIINGINLLLVCCILFGVLYETNKIWSCEYYIDGKVEKKLGLGKLPRYPKGAVNFVKRNDIKGNIFNSFNYGHYLIWRFYPERKVFIDGRVELYRKNILRIYGNSLIYEDFINKVVKKYNINYFLLSTSLNETLDKYLYESKKWELVYFSSQALIFVKDVPSNEEIIKKHRVKMENWINKYKRLKDINEKYYDKIRPEVFSLVNEGIFLGNIGRLKEAKLAFKETIQLNSHFQNAYTLLADIYIEQKKYKKVIGILEKAIEKGLSSNQIFGNLGYAYEKIGNKDKALKYYKKAISGWNGKPSAGAYRNLAVMYYNKGLYRKALMYIENALRLSPHSYRNYHIKGTIYSSMGLYDKSKKALEEAVSLNPSFAKAYSNLGFCYYKLGFKGTAVKTLKGAIELDSSLTSTKKLLNKIEE